LQLRGLYRCGTGAFRTAARNDDSIDPAGLTAPAVPGRNMPVSRTDEQRVAAAAAAIPPAAGFDRDEDLVVTLLVTVVDFQMRTATVNRALDHFRTRRWSEVRTLEDLEALLARFPDDGEGNTALAERLWGYRLWTRAALLRGLVRFVVALGVDDQDGFRAWAATAEFARDFEGQVPGLGRAVFQGLVMRLGVDTVKPDVHLRRFTEGVLGRRLSDDDVVAVVVGAAGELGVRACELDWAIWEHQRAAGS
jgi:hypothetical protein